MRAAVAATCSTLSNFSEIQQGTYIQEFEQRLNFKGVERFDTTLIDSWL